MAAPAHSASEALGTGTPRAADRICFVEAGRIVEQGSHDELMARSDSSYRRYVELQTLGAA